MTPLFAVSNLYWNLPVLLVVFSLVYSATRHDRWDRILREAVGWVVRIGSFLVIVGVGLYVSSSYPDYWPHLLAVAIVLTAVYLGITTMLARRHAEAPPRG